MKTKGLVLVLCLFMTLGVAAKEVNGNGNIVTKEVSVSSYESIEIGRGINKYSDIRTLFKGKENPKFRYSQTEGAAKLTISIDENLFPLLEITSSDGVLVIETGKDIKIGPTKMEIIASSVGLKDVKVSGCMDFELMTPLTADNLTIAVSGIGNTLMAHPVQVNTLAVSISGVGELRANNLTCGQISGNVSGTGSLKLVGKAESAKFSVSGTGNIEAYGFNVKEADVRVSGVGRVDVYASESLNATASGVGSINYKGNPASVETNKSGVGSIKAN